MMNLFGSKNETNFSGKVIPLPNKRTKKALLLLKRAKFKEHQRAVFSGSLLTLILVVSLVNHKIWNQQPQQTASRGIASVENRLFEEELTPWQKSIANRLQMSVKSKEAVLGEQPGDLDKLRYGELGGNYDFISKNGKIFKVELAQNREPIRIENLPRLLKQYANLFAHDFDKIEFIKESSDKLAIKQHYHLTKKGKINAALRVERDSDNNLVGFFLE